MAKRTEVRDLQWCTYQQSQGLKRIGFNWYTPQSYLNGAKIADPWANDWTLPSAEIERISCPTTALVSKWMRDSRVAVLEITPVDSWDSWVVTVLFADIMSPFFVIPAEIKEYKTFEEAESAGIDTVLNELNTRI